MRGTSFIFKGTALASAIFCAYWLGESRTSRLTEPVASVTGSSSQTGEAGQAADLALVAVAQSAEAAPSRQLTSLPTNAAPSAPHNAPSMLNPEYAPIFDLNAKLPPAYALNAYGHRVPVLPPPTEVYDSRPDQIKPRTLENVMANLPPASTEFDRR